MPEITDPALLSQLNATGDDALKTMTPERAAAAKAIAEGRMPIPTGTALRSPAGQQMLNDALAYDPTIDVKNEKGRVKAYQAFTSGPQSQNITSFNTALGHLNELAKAAEDLNNGSFPAVNYIENAVGPQVGFTDLAGRIKRFNTAKSAVVEELSRAFKGAAPDVHSAQQWESNISASDSPEAIRSSVKEAAALLQSRIEAMQNSYNNAMGTNRYNLPMLNPHSLDALQHFQSDDYIHNGYKPPLTPIAGAAMGGGGNPPPGAPPASGGAPVPPNGPQGPNGGAPKTAWDQPDGTLLKEDAGTEATYKTPQDQKYADAVQYLLDKPGSTRADFDAVSAQFGYPKMGTDLDAALAAKAKHPRAVISVTTPSSGQRSEAAQLGNTALSMGRSALIGAGDAASFGTMNKIGSAVDAGLQSLGGDQRSFGDIYNQDLASANLRRDISNVTNPGSTLAGNVAGFMTGDAVLGGGLKAIGTAAPALGRLAGRVVPTVARPIAQDAAYGAAYGAGSSDNLSDVPRNAIDGAGLAALGGVLGRQTVRIGAAALSPAVSPIVRRLTDAGVTLTPGTIFGADSGIIGRNLKNFEDRLTSIDGIGDAIQGAREMGAKDLNRAVINKALAPIGETASGIGHAGIGDMQAKVSDALDRALSPINAAPDGALKTDIDAAIRGARNNLSGDRLGDFNRVIENNVKPYLSGSTIAGDDIKNIKQGLDKKIANLRDQGASPQDRDLADSLEDIKESFLGFAQRVDPSATKDYSNALEAYALAKRVSLAASKSDDSIFSPAQLRQAVTKRGYGTTTDILARGEAPLQQISTDANAIMPSRTADSGTFSRQLAAHFLGMGPGAALGGTAGYAENGSEGALAGAALGALAFSRPGLRAAQTVLAGSRPKAVTTLGDWMRANASLGGAVGVPLALDYLPR